MAAVLAGLVPVFGVILLGYGLARRARFDDRLWPGVERLVYWVLFPALLCERLATATFPAGDALPLAVALGGSTAGLGVVLLGSAPAWMPALGVGGPGASSVVQGAVRMNSYVGLAAADALFGAQGLVLMAAVLAVMVPLMNLLGVLALIRLGSDRSAGGGAVALGRAVMGNPLIAACLVGLVLNLTGVGLAPVLADLLAILGRASLPLGLLAVGAGLVPAALGRSLPCLAAACTLKLLVLPGLVWVSGLAVGLDGAALSVAILFAGLPVSASAYVMARRMGGDGEMMGAILTLQTLLSAVTLPVLVTLTL